MVAGQEGLIVTRFFGYLFVVLFLSACGKDSGVSLPGAVSPNCEARTQAAVEASTKIQMDWYRAHGGVEPSPAQHSQYLAGTNGKVVVLVHGFISSPAYMTDLAKTLNDAGYAVLVPLLTGFGAGAEAANSAKVSDWKASVQTALSQARDCHEDVSVVAHSLGTALTTIALEDKADVKRVVLLAPYFKAYSSWAGYLGRVIGKATDTLDAKIFEKYLGVDPFEYFSLERPAGGEENGYFPITAMQEVLSLQKVFAEPASGPKLSLPLLAVVSESDTIIDGKYAKEYLGNHFENPRYVVFPADDKIAHTFQSRKGNSHYDEMARDMLGFLANEQAPINDER